MSVRKLLIDEVEDLEGKKMHHYRVEYRIYDKDAMLKKQGARSVVLVEAGSRGVAEKLVTLAEPLAVVKTTGAISAADFRGLSARKIYENPKNTI